jgi:hypothetical protein
MPDFASDSKQGRCALYRICTEEAWHGLQPSLNSWAESLVKY